MGSLSAWQLEVAGIRDIALRATWEITDPLDGLTSALIGEVQAWLRVGEAWWVVGGSLEERSNTGFVLHGSDITTRRV